MVENLFATDMSLLWSETCITEGLAQQQGSRFREGIAIAPATLWGSIALGFLSPSLFTWLIAHYGIFYRLRYPLS